MVTPGSLAPDDAAARRDAVRIGADGRFTSHDRPRGSDRRLPESRSSSASLALIFAGCAAAPLVPFSTDTPPLILVPAAQAGVQDKRGRFREIYCAVLAARATRSPTSAPATTR